MTFCEALPYLTGGDRICRELHPVPLRLWSDGYIHNNKTSFDWSVHKDDLTLNDWYVLPLREWTEETNARE